jgi:hypothetical protein
VLAIVFDPAHAENKSFKTVMVDEKFSSSSYPPVQPQGGGGGGGRRVDPKNESPPPKKRQKLSQDDLALLVLACYQCQLPVSLHTIKCIIVACRASNKQEAGMEVL